MTAVRNEIQNAANSKPSSELRNFQTGSIAIIGVTPVQTSRARANMGEKTLNCVNAPTPKERGGEATRALLSRAMPAMLRRNRRGVRPRVQGSVPPQARAGPRGTNGSNRRRRVRGDAEPEGRRPGAAEGPLRDRRNPAARPRSGENVCLGDPQGAPRAARTGDADRGRAD